MSRARPHPSDRFRHVASLVGIGTVGALLAGLIELTLADFHVPGTQVGAVDPANFLPSSYCTACHEVPGTSASPGSSWEGSLMAHAGRDPLFFAQLATANQDVSNAGYYCLRCHVPMSIVTGHALDADGSTLDATDRAGLGCHFCHAMVDPIYRAGESPAEDAKILGSLSDRPDWYGNAMWVLDPGGTRRGPRADATPPHELLPSPFHRRGEFCGTCHDVGNVAVSKQTDGTFRYNAPDTPAPDANPLSQFPLERTYTEWKLSAFANGGVEMGGRYGEPAGFPIATCQDCHMPRSQGTACVMTPARPDLAAHDFSGASDWVLQIIGLYYQGNPEVSQSALQRGRTNAVAMLRRSVSLELRQSCNVLQVRLYNESGHKLPTGHIEGRRMWLHVRVLDAAGALLAEYGRYDPAEAILDESSTTVYEMKVGLSDDAARATGLPSGTTTHMALADTIIKDNRIPPRGYSIAAYELAGAPAVGADYSEGQYWSDSSFSLPFGAATATATVNYQTVTRHYIESLRDGNVTNHWGNTLYGLWLQADRGAPILVASETIRVASTTAVPDLDCDGVVDGCDLGILLGSWGASTHDLDADGVVGPLDLVLLLGAWGAYP